MINTTLDLDLLMERIRKIAMEELQAEKATIFLGDEAKQELHSAYLEDTYLDINLAFGSGIAGTVAKEGKSIIIDDAQNDERFYKGVDELSGFITNTILCSPMFNKEHTLIGVFQALNSKHGKFSKDDARFLEDLSIQAALAIENAWLYAEAQEKRKLEEDLDLARDIQTKLLPLSLPDIPGYDIAAVNIPAQAVGGDYYDFMVVDDEGLYFALGDVSGKGISAALLMASLQASFRSQAAASAEIADLTSSLNNHIFNSTPSSKYITFFSGILQLKDGSIKYCNAGHNPPLLIKNDGSSVYLKTGGIPLGFVLDSPYGNETLSLSQGEILLLFSDGVTETFDENEVEFGDSRLSELIASNRNLDGTEIINLILDNLKEYSGEELFLDDVTMLMIKRLS